MGCGCGPGETCEDMDNEMLSEADLARFGRESDYGASCAECGEELYEDAALCTGCGALQEQGSRDGLAGMATGPRWQGMSKVIIPVVVLLLIITFVMMT